LARLQLSLQSGKLDASSPITIGDIVRSNIIHGISGFSGVKLLGPHDPELPLPPLKLELSRFSKSAADAVKAAGGEVLAVYKNKLALRREVWPDKVLEGKDADPVRKADIRKYSLLAVKR
jgi:large subunit ribosomal protein L15